MTTDSTEKTAPPSADAHQRRPSLRHRCCSKRVLLGALLLITALNLTVFRIPDAPPATGKQLALNGEVSIHYTERRGKGPTIVLVHGLPGTLGDLQNVDAALKGRHVIALDRPGFGGSKGPGPKDLAGQTEMIADFLAAKKVSGATFVGHSYGGGIAQLMGRRHPELVSAVVLVSGIGADQQLGFDGTVMNAAQRSLGLPVIGTALQLTTGNISNRIGAALVGGSASDPEPVDPAFIERVRRISLSDRDRDTTVENRGNVNADLRALKPLAKGLGTATGVAVVHGAGDQLAPVQVGCDVARLTGAHALILRENVGHMLPITQPQLVVQGIAAAERAAAYIADGKRPSAAGTPPRSICR